MLTTSRRTAVRCSRKRASWILKGLSRSERTRRTVRPRNLRRTGSRSKIGSTRRRKDARSCSSRGRVPTDSVTHRIPDESTKLPAPAEAPECDHFVYLVIAFESKPTVFVWSDENDQLERTVDAVNRGGAPLGFITYAKERDNWRLSARVFIGISESLREQFDNLVREGVWQYRLQQ